MPIKISVAMATYNGQKYLREQLESIYSQTYLPDEVIVCDDNSNDNTVEILKEYSKKYNLKYEINRTNLGFVKNFEKAITLCSGKYIALSDQDDIWEINKLEILINEIGSYDLIHSNVNIIDGESQAIAKNYKGNASINSSFGYYAFKNNVTGCATMITSNLQKFALPIPKGELYHDWWFALCATKLGGIHYHPHALTNYRKHSEQDTGVEKQALPLLDPIANIYKRIVKKETTRLKYARIQVKRLPLIKNDKRFTDNEKLILNDCLTFNMNYLESIIHFKTFMISLRYSKFLYNRNFLFIRNIYQDIIG